MACLPSSHRSSRFPGLAEGKGPRERSCVSREEVRYLLVYIRQRVFGNRCSCRLSVFFVPVSSEIMEPDPAVPQYRSPGARRSVGHSLFLGLLLPKKETTQPDVKGPLPVTSRNDEKRSELMGTSHSLQVSAKECSPAGKKKIHRGSLPKRKCSPLKSGINYCVRYALRHSATDSQPLATHYVSVR